MKNKKYAFEDEADIAAIEAFERGALKPVAHQKKALETARQAAVHFRLKKEARINIRLPEIDILNFKDRAAEEGMPYQTLIASILHKYLNGRLVEVRTKRG